MQSVTPFLWLNADIADAARFYVQTFDDARILSGPDVGPQMSSATIEVVGQRIHLFNAGPHSELTQAFSLMVSCESQSQIDRLWQALSHGGTELRCGWVTDRYGLTWQIVPEHLSQWLTDPVHGAAVTQRMLQMRKLEIEPLLAVMR